MGLVVACRFAGEWNASLVACHPHPNPLPKGEGAGLLKFEMFQTAVNACDLMIRANVNICITTIFQTACNLIPSPLGRGLG